MAMKVVALAGNPNVGKTTVFNSLTGMRQHVGNWPGVTVEKKEGVFEYKGEKFLVVDLPGTYSLTAHSIDELVARNFLLNGNPDVVVNVVDATSLLRNLLLTMEIFEMGLKNVVIALNKIDLAEKKGIRIDPIKMSKALGVPVVAMSAKEGIGVEELKEKIYEMANGMVKTNPVVPRYDPEVEREIEHIIGCLKGTELEKRYPLRWLAIKLLQRDDEVMKLVLRHIGEEKLKEIMTHIGEAEARYGRAMDLIIASQKYEFIDRLTHEFMSYAGREGESLTDQLDRILIHPVYGFIALAIVFYGVFKFVFALGLPLQEWLDGLFASFGEWLAPHIANETLRGLVVDGVIGGVGSVLSFFPLVFLLFFALSVLEDVGYMARVAVLMEGIMRKFGLPGKAVIPLILGLGCNVPAVMATRTLEDERDRLVAMFVNPFIPCSARLSVISFLAGTFFSSNHALVALSVYLIAILVALLSAWFVSHFVVRGEESPFVIELPEYLIPSWKTVILHSWERSKEFVKKAGTVILLGSIFIWYLSNYPVELGSGKSYAETLGYLFEPYMMLMGLDWKAAVSLIFGIIAKENVISTYGVIYGTTEAIKNAMTPLQAYVLAVVTTLYIPCIATIGAIRAESNWKWALFTTAYMIAVASIVGILIWHVGIALGLS
ncbi:iron(II) transport protein B [Thermococcus kodakarensis KOD1]|uniref:Ferrous iron transport protein B n=1 Tax=Thermococcus kodakarensis (strain ATCC BAA-918 / JCM 12380 / KOD1) TaxID=69014 RepID=Q5JIC6_THEKO|nr:ferrous iron transport protein B [Thermococcus kodakarensis]WCN28935.1 ferrous iron transport protein B [Thermococcus kodakarensis]WCN31239.1 ferrous iron transport protein B [Thermococcus kodakarensis]BAD85146.1 iron(II) transport protein B [Thermococcus kodakarensis KOD1]